MDDSKYPEDPADIQKGKALFDVASYSGSHSAGMDAVEWLKNNANAMFDEIKALREKTATEARLSSVRAAMTIWVGDWSEDRIHAWIYGVIVGWDDASLAELAVQFGWHSEAVERLKALMPKDRNDDV